THSGSYSAEYLRLEINKFEGMKGTFVLFTYMNSNVMLGSSCSPTGCIFALKLVWFEISKLLHEIIPFSRRQMKKANERSYIFSYLSQSKFGSSISSFFVVFF